MAADPVRETLAGAGTRPGVRRRDLPANRAAAIGLTHLMDRYGWPIKMPTGRLTPLQIWSRSDNELVRLLDLPAPSARELLAHRRRFDPSVSFNELKQMEITFLALGDPSYPACLSQIHDPPPGLFIKGDFSRFEEMIARPRVAIVGARAASGYGLDAARTMAQELSREGVCIVSGMATGIDAAAHEGALRAGETGGGTIAVLGCGTDVVYPRSNGSLYRDIHRSGVIISEYSPGTEPRPWRFPARNRIIAGLADGVLVVEAREKSGALITADFCLEQGREVWAVPGSIFSDLSSGPHRLIRLGATAASCAADVIEDLGLESRPRGAVPPGTEARIPSGLSEDEGLIFSILKAHPAHPDVLALKTGLDGARTGAALITLELKGLARQDNAGCYSR